MTAVDWLAFGVVALGAFGGLRQGLVGTGLSLAGLVGGAIVGARAAAHILSNGTSSPYLPVASLVGAIVGALILQAVAGAIASFLRRGLRLLPPLRALDSVGGLVAGAAWGLVVVWVCGTIALQYPGQTSLRDAVQRSVVLRRLNQIAPPSTVLRALGRIDQLPALTGPAPPTLPPDRKVLAEAAVQAARGSVVKVTATACGLGLEGSGWVVAPQLVVTAAHVIAGASEIDVDGLRAHAYAIDHTNDVAVLDVPSLSARPLPYGAAQPGEAVAILGYPENGPFDARSGRIGATERAVVSGQPRSVTVFGGLVRPGNSGGPVVDSHGVVRTTVFARRIGSEAGFGVPDGPVRAAVADAHGPVSTGSC